MLKKLLNTKMLKNQKGLTLIELLAVVVILGIIAAIAIPAIGGIIENTKYKAVKADAINIINASNIYFTDRPDEKKVEVSVLLADSYLDTQGKFIGTDYVEKVAGGNKLTATEIKYSGDKTVKFTGATITKINEDNNKGSGSGGYTIQ